MFQLCPFQKKKTKNKQQSWAQLFLKMMEFFAKMINGFKLLIFSGFALEVLDVPFKFAKTIFTFNQSKIDPVTTVF